MPGKTRSRTVAIPRRRRLPSALGIIRSRTGNGRKLWSRTCDRSSSRTPRHPRRDGRRGSAIHPGGAGTLVAPHPIPGDQQERRIGDEVEQIIEPAMRIITGPTVQLGLNLPYPSLRPKQRELRFVGIHRRPPGISASSLPTCWPPSPCARLSRALNHHGASAPSHGHRSTTDLPHQPDRLPGGKGDRGWFPRSPRNRSMRGRRPPRPRQHRHAYAAVLRRGLPTGPSKPATELTSHPHARCRSRAAHRPISVRFEPALDLRGVRQRFLSYAFSSLLAGPGPSDNSGPSRTLSGLLPTLPRIPAFRRVGPADCSAGPPSAWIHRRMSGVDRVVTGQMPSDLG